MKPAKGTTVTIVAPPKPAEVKDAVNSAAGKLEQTSGAVKSATAGSFSSTKISGSSSSSAPDSTAAAPAEEKHQPNKAKKGWIEIVLKDEEGTPQGGARFKITLPDGTVADGTLDDKGKARVDGFESGQCKVAFPDLDEKVWNPK
jgi:hypothetical protein